MSSDLKRTLDLKDSISVTAGSMIGCGIFIVSADIARQVESAFFLIIVWIIAGLFSLSGAIAYAEPVLNIKEDGGQYIFLKKMFNDLTAFLYGWSLLLVIQTATIGAVCIAVGKFLGILFPWISSTKYLIQTPFFSISTQQICALIVCIILTYINSRGIKYGVLTQNIFTATKILSIAGIIVFGIFFGCSLETITANFPYLMKFSDISISELEIISTATVGAIFAMVTWNNITFISAEVKDPDKNIPKALFWGVLLVFSLYLLINLLYVCSIPTEQIKTAPEDVVAVVLMQNIAGELGKIIIAIIILISACGSANGLIMTGARVYYQMAKDNLLFKSLAALNTKTNVPVNSLLLQCIWACMFILFCGNYSELLDYVIYAALIFYVLTAIGIFVYRFKNKETIKNKVPSLYGIFFIVTGSYIIYALTLNKFSSSMKTLLIIATGIPIYLAWKKFKNLYKIK
ncbi:MAG: amino acid permease [Candidatus Gastranaerophilales bacterium]|nr:amino acid permease [Candidatus Gastranaerophilales bacterium]